NENVSARVNCVSIRLREGIAFRIIRFRPFRRPAGANRLRAALFSPSRLPAGTAPDRFPVGSGPESPAAAKDLPTRHASIYLRSRYGDSQFPPSAPVRAAAAAFIGTACANGLR